MFVSLLHYKHNNNYSSVDKSLNRDFTVQAFQIFLGFREYVKQKLLCRPEKYSQKLLQHCILIQYYEIQ